MEDLEAERHALSIVGMLLRCRRSADLSQRDLAALLDVAPSTVARWETGERCPSGRLMLRIAELAGYQLILAEPDPGAEVEDRGLEQTDAAPPAEVTPAIGMKVALPAGDVPVETFLGRSFLGFPPVEHSYPPGRGPLARRRHALGSLRWRTPEPWPEDPLRDAAGRRLPSHLDVYLCSPFSELRPDTRFGELYAPRRPGRNLLRLKYHPHELYPAGTSPLPIRTYIRMPTWQDLADWHEEHRKRRVRRRHQVHTEPAPDPICECPLECMDSPGCPDGCPCQCEPILDPWGGIRSG